MRADPELIAAKNRLDESIHACLFLYFHTCFPMASVEAVNTLADIVAEKFDEAAQSTIDELTPIVIKKALPN